MLVQAVKEGTAINPLAARSIFWELKATVADPAFEKEAWLTAALYTFGDCGFTIGDEATVFFCSADLAPGAAKLPTSPVSADAAILSSLFVGSDRAGRGLEAVLIDAALVNLTARGFGAVESFGYRDAAAATALLGSKPARIGLLDTETLTRAGFEVVQDHAITPRLRLELPPEFSLMTAAAVEDALARALA